MSSAVYLLKCHRIGSPGVDAPGRLSHRALPLSVVDRWSNRYRHRLGDLVLYREDVGEIAIVPLRPDVIPGLGLDELRGDADTITGLAHAAFEHIAHAELAPDLLHLDGLAPVGEARIASGCARVP